MPFRTAFGQTWLQRMDLGEALIGENMRKHEKTAVTWPQAGIVDAYVASLHWSLTQFTPSTNNVAPANSLERRRRVRMLERS